MIEAELDGLASPEALHSAAKLAGGDLDKARFLAGKRGSDLRVAAERLMTCALEDEFAGSPWLDLLAQARSAGEHSGEPSRPTSTRKRKRASSTPRPRSRRRCGRAQRKTRTGMLDLGLHLAAAWARDWATIIAGAPTSASTRTGSGSPRGPGGRDRTRPGP